MPEKTTEERKKEVSGALVLIKTKLGEKYKVLEKLKETVGVTEAYLVDDHYDVVAKIVSKSVEGTKNIIVHNIRNMDGVLSTTTMMILE